MRPSLGMDCPAQVIHPEPFPFLFPLDINGSIGDFCGKEGILLLGDLEGEPGTSY